MKGGLQHKSRDRYVINMVISESETVKHIIEHIFIRSVLRVLIDIDSEILKSISSYKLLEYI